MSTDCEKCGEFSLDCTCSDMEGLHESYKEKVKDMIAEFVISLSGEDMKEIDMEDFIDLWVEKRFE